MTRSEFVEEIASLVRETFAASPVDEVDIWASIPLRAGGGVFWDQEWAHAALK